MSIASFFRGLFSDSYLKVRVEGTTENGAQFTAKIPYGESVRSSVEREAFLAHARNRIFVDKGLRVTTMHIVGACEVHPDLDIDGKVRFEATLADGRHLTGRLPYQGDLVQGGGLAEIRAQLARQLLVETGQRCRELRITGAY